MILEAISQYHMIRDYCDYGQLYLQLFRIDHVFITINTILFTEGNMFTKNRLGVCEQCTTVLIQ